MYKAGVARTDGSHLTHVIHAMFVVHGQMYIWNCRPLRIITQHLCSQEQQAIQSGVNHKYCSPNHLQVALNILFKENEHLQADKIASLSKVGQKLLHHSWHPMRDKPVDFE